MSEIRNPFKFLDAYTKDDANIFFGREKEIEELYYKIFNGKILIVYGSSGTGKTSLIQCGLASKFQESDWMPIAIRRGANINSSFEKVMHGIALTPIKSNSDFMAMVQSIYLDYFKPIYLIFDQFEELFILGTDDEIQTFIEQLRLLLKANVNCKCVFVIRGEYLENLAQFEEKIPDIFDNRVRLERMTRSNAMRVVNEPCHLYNIAVGENFTSLLLDKFGGHKATIELTYLQVYLDKLFKKSLAELNGNPAFTVKLLESLGKIDDVLGEFLDEQLAKTSNPEDALIILKGFVSGEGTKKPVVLKEVSDFVSAMGSKLSQQDIEAYLRKFVDLRILKDRDDTGRYELRHDALAKKIFEHISMGEKEMIEVRQFVLNRFNEFKNRKILLEVKDIDYIRPYLHKLFLTEEQKAFIDRSRSQVRRIRIRRRNTYIAITFLSFIILAAFTINSIKERNDAVKLRDDAIQLKNFADENAKEAVNQKEIAEKQKEYAVEASKKAMDAESFAKLQSDMALEEKKVATEQAARAEMEAKNAEIQKKNATEQQLLAEQKSKEALAEKNTADSAQAVANRMRLISLSQTVAFKSMQVQDAELSALMAFESYRLAKNNGGSVLDPQLYSALYSATQKIVPSYNEIIIRENNQINALAAPSSSILVLSGSTVKKYSAGTFSLTTHYNLNKLPSGTDFTSFNNEGTALLENSDDNNGYVWDLNKQDKTPVILRGHKGLIRAVAFTDNLNLIATGGRDSNVIFWKNLSASIPLKMSSRVKALAFNPGNTKLIVGCEDGFVYSCNPSTNEVKTLSNDAGGRTNALGWSSDGKCFAAGYSDGNIEVFDGSGEKIRNILEQSGIECIFVDAKQDLLILATSGKVIKMYSLTNKSAKPVTISYAGSPVKALSVSTDGILFVACADNSIRHYPLNTGYFETLLQENIKRNFTTEEWNVYIGADIPYEKITNN